MSSIPWLTDWSFARQLARTSRKPILVDFYSETCYGCNEMDAVTYRAGEVIDFLPAHFVPVKFNVKQPVPAFQELLRMVKPLFTPLLLALSPEGTEIRRTTGYLPPADFLSELELVLGSNDLLYGRHAEAYRRFRGVAEHYSRLPSAPEALFWSGVAAYRLDGKGLDGLLPEWAELRAKYPDTTWGSRVSCIASKLDAVAAA